MAQKYLGEILIDEGLLSPDDLETALKKQKKQLGEILVEMEVLAEEDLERALEIQSRGQTRAQIYLARLRVAVAALCVVSLLAAGAVWRAAQQARFDDEVEGGQLGLTRLMALVGDPGTRAGLRLDALRSVPNLARADEQAVVLRQALQDPAWSVRLFALTQVDGLGLKELCTDVVPLLLDETPAVKREAHRLLKEYTGQDFEDDFRTWYQWAKGQGWTVVQPDRLRQVGG